jgi:hypothetical protein
VRQLVQGGVAAVAAAVALTIGTLPSAAAAPPGHSPATGSPTGEHAVTYRLETPDGTFAYGWRPLSDVRPASASGCNRDVCISIIGHSNYVSDWGTTAYWGGGYICTHSFWWLNDRRIRTGNGACGRAGVFFSDWHPKRNFPYPSLACNTWQRIPGRPCETIHK